MAKRLYVGNLKYTVTSAELQELFEQYGTVSTAQVLSDRETGRSRGFGFVEMDNDDEALAAIESLDGQDHDGRRLTVNEARPATPGWRRWRWRWRRRLSRRRRLRRRWRRLRRLLIGRPSVSRLVRARRPRSLIALVRPRVARRNSGFFVMQQSAIGQIGFSRRATAILGTDRAGAGRAGSARTCGPTAGTSNSSGIDEDSIVQVRLTGACQGCSSSLITHDDAGRVHPEGRGAGDPLRRGRAVIRPLDPGTGRAALAMAARGLRPHPLLRPQVRLLRLRLAGGRRPSGRPLPGRPRARDGDRAWASPRRWTRSSSAAGRRRGWMPPSSSG